MKWQKNANKLWERYCHVYCLSVWVPARILVPCSLWFCNENLDKISSFWTLNTNMILYIIYSSTWANVKYSNEHLGKKRGMLTPHCPLHGIYVLALPSPSRPSCFKALWRFLMPEGRMISLMRGVVNSLSKPKTKQSETRKWDLVHSEKKLVNRKSLLKTLSNQTKPSTSSKLCKPPESSAPKSVYNITECGAVCHRSWASTQERNAVVPDP